MGKFLSTKKGKVIIAAALCIIITAGIFFTTRFLKNGSTFSAKIGTVYKKTSSFSEFTDTFSKEFLLRNPKYANIAGSFNGEDSDFYSIFANTFMDSKNESYVIYRKYLEDIKGLGISGLKENEMLTQEVIKWYLEDYIESEKYQELKWLINPVDGLQITISRYLMDVFQIKSSKDAEDYIKILSAYGTIFDNALDKMKDDGFMLPKGLMDNTIIQMETLFLDQPNGCALYNDFTAKVLKLKDIDTKKKQELFKKAESEIEKTVYPAYKRILKFLKEQQPKAPDNINADSEEWKEYYKYSLKHYTTMDLDPGKVHDMALKKVEDLKKEFEKVYKQVILKEFNISGVEVDFKFEDKIGVIYSTMTGEDQILDYYRTTIEGNRECAARVFSYVPDDKIRIQMGSADSIRWKEDTYIQSSIDGKKRADLYVNKPQYTSAEPRKLLLSILEETYPGHHMQQTIQHNMKDEPLFRRLYNFNSYYQGWGYYAERLGFDNELFKPDYNGDSRKLYQAKLAYIQSQLFYAALAAADTGINYRGWSKERAYSYVSQNSGITISSEINNCFTAPGSGCVSFVAGMKFIELRDRAKEELGNKFDIKEFHDVVLKNGSIPLEMLEQQVQKYIDSKK